MARMELQSFTSLSKKLVRLFVVPKMLDVRNIRGLRSVVRELSRLYEWAAMRWSESEVSGAVTKLFLGSDGDDHGRHASLMLTGWRFW